MTEPATRLILIGYWRSDRDPHWPDPNEMVDSEWDEDERYDVDAHLRHGLLAYLGPSFCRVCGARVGNEELTDGVYVWPEGLAHYVRDHSGRLPAAFVEHVRHKKDERDDFVIDSDWWLSLPRA